MRIMVVIICEALRTVPGTGVSLLALLVNFNTALFILLRLGKPRLMEIKSIAGHGRACKQTQIYLPAVFFFS